MADSDARVTPRKRRRMEPSPPQFFKPVLPGFLDNFSIPRSFLKHLRPRESNNGDDLIAVFKRRRSCGDEEEKAWHVRVDGDGKRFKDGWKEFALDQRLHVGDFLVFRHLCGFVFDVLVFDPVTACERCFSTAPPLALTNSGHSDMEAKTVQENIGGKDFEMTQQNLEVNAQSDCVKEYKITEEKCLEVIQVNIAGKDYEMSEHQSQETGHVQSVDNANTQSEKMGDVHSIGKGSALLEQTVGDHSKEKDNVDSGTSGDVDFTGKESTSSEERIDFIPSGHPYFCTSVKKYCFKWHAMLIPTDFARLNNLAKRWCEMILIDQKDRAWPVNLRYRKNGKDQAYLASGWDQFQAANKLKIGDSVVFELINSGSQPIMKFYSMLSIRTYSHFDAMHS